MYYAYILLLKNGEYYAGHTDDLKRRIKEHSSGVVKSTKHLQPSELIFYAAFRTKEKAVAFEKYLKSSSGFAFRNKRLI